MTTRQYAQKDHEYAQVFDAALRLQHRCELAGMTVQAQQAREIRRQANVRLIALHSNRPMALRP